MSEFVVRVQDLRKTYRGGLEALRGVSFDIRRGETFALLGPNGAGKSTVIEILEGYRDRTSGDVSVLGVDPHRGGLDWKARLGIVLQNTGEAPTATVRELLSHFASFYPRPRDVDEVIAAVGLTEKAKVSVRKLSGGQRRRVDVALGIVGRPELLFLDEPTTGFDPEVRRQFWDLIRTLQAEGTTILLTTHYLDEAAELAERAAILVGGEVASVGRIEELGGPDARVPVVRWREGDTVRERRTENPGAVVAELYGRLGEPSRLEVVRPSLEDVYLSFLGDEARRTTAAGGLA
ncbi:ABC transporter ATP-binding protein [Microbacterium enclense]|uniref:ABC-2 type transport system ATP-binding protein n=1 Tax=Microbacterium enclense TaxID=993073 RepID=A0A1G6P1K7_9MICO|nr:ABC transporter ATP-binding protein [Microbacterium enclense]KSU52667.1 ABC transporter [Microbacterium enclense]SDC73919.1 ABC-2 type transport system ATP-binding protein [Microbacterium enclense]